MEALAVGSSIVGLLGVAGQCISGVCRLVSFYQDITKASSTVEAFLKDLQSLLRTLYDVQTLLEKIRDHPSGTPNLISATSLKIQLEDCHKDVGTWLQAARANQPTSSQGTRGTSTWFKAFWVVVNKNSVKNIRADINTRRNELSTALSVLGRSFDCQIESTTAKIRHDVQTLVDINNTHLENYGRLEALSISISHSISSLQSGRSIRAASPIPGVATHFEIPGVEATTDYEESVLEDPRERSDTLLVSSWDASLLLEWTTLEDRINRWILHGLGRDERQAELHRQICRDFHVQLEDDGHPDAAGWSRLVVKYWFSVDAAPALGSFVMPADDQEDEVAHQGPNTSLKGRTWSSTNSKGQLADVSVPAHVSPPPLLPSTRLHPASSSGDPGWQWLDQVRDISRPSGRSASGTLAAQYERELYGTSASPEVQDLQGRTANEHRNPLGERFRAQRKRPRREVESLSSSRRSSISSYGVPSTHSAESGGSDSGQAPERLYTVNKISNHHICTLINPSTNRPCDTAFSRPQDLRRHEDVFHSSRRRSYECPYCREEKKFSLKPGLVRHIRVVHPEIFSGASKRPRIDQTFGIESSDGSGVSAN